MGERGDSPRANFHRHPWSIGGGGAAELKEEIQESAEKTLFDFVEVRRKKANIGFASFTGLDEAFLSDRATLRRAGIENGFIRELIKGDVVRDWQITPEDAALAPYDSSFRIAPLAIDAPWCRFLWYDRTVLRNISSFESTREDEGSAWWGWYRWIPEKYRRPLSIAFAEVASHNHFALDSGGRVFKQTAPIIKLPATATKDDHLALLALLNSSTICFMMKQTSHQKQMTGGDGVRVDTKAKVPYQFGGTQLQKHPHSRYLLKLGLSARGSSI